MTPYERCKELFEQRYPAPYSWAAEVEFWSKNGVVHATPDYFVAGCKTNHRGNPDIMRRGYFEEASKDTWFFAWFAGDMEKVWRAEEPLEFVAWERLRDGEMTLQIARTEALKRLTSSHG